MFEYHDVQLMLDNLHYKIMYPFNYIFFHLDQIEPFVPHPHSYGPVSLPL